MRRLARVLRASVKVAATVGFVGAVGAAGCRCTAEEAPSGGPATASAPEELADPTVAPAVGWTCPVAAEVPPGPAPEGAVARFADLAVRAMPHWAPPTTDTERFLHLPGVRDPVGDKAEGGVMLRHALPGEKFAILAARPHDLPPGRSFDAAGARAVFDDVAASPEVALVTVSARRWAGHAAVEGVVFARGSSERTAVHHLVVQLDGGHALDVVYLAPESQYRRYLGDACASIAAVAPAGGAAK